MEYFVVMTTRVPERTPERRVAEVREREASQSRDLAARGYLLRLWRPPLQRGEWRSVGLFAANDGTQLEGVLASMPLRVWRTDEVTPLRRHPNDPARPEAGDEAEFLTTFTLSIPDCMPSRALEETEAEEAFRAKQLAEQGKLERLWALPGQGRTLGLWQANDVLEMEAIVRSLPMSRWLTTEITPLTPHPNDPAVTKARA